MAKAARHAVALSNRKYLQSLLMRDDLKLHLRRSGLYYDTHTKPHRSRKDTGCSDRLLLTPITSDSNARLAEDNVVPTNPASPHIIVQGMGMQQHENSPQSMQRVEPGAEVLTMLSTVDEAAEPGPL